MHDEIETHLRGLEALGVDMATFSGFVVPVLMERLPETVRLNMIRFSGADQMDWTLQNFLDGLEKEISLRESYVPLKTVNVGAGEMRFSGSSGDRWNRTVAVGSREAFGTANALLTEKANDKTCVYFLHKHEPADCKKVKSSHERKSVLRKYAKCFICLMSGHRAYECRYNAFCKHCNGKHHASFCDKPKQGGLGSNVNKESAAKSNSATLNPQAATWVGSTYCGKWPYKQL